MVILRPNMSILCHCKRKKDPGGSESASPCPLLSGGWVNLVTARFSWKRRRWREGQRSISSQLDWRMRGRWIFRGPLASTESSSVVHAAGWWWDHRVLITCRCVCVLSKKGLFIWKFICPQEGPQPMCTSIYQAMTNLKPQPVLSTVFLQLEELQFVVSWMHACFSSVCRSAVDHYKS